MRNYLLLFPLLFIGCGQQPSTQSEQGDTKQTIAISWFYKNSSYQNWLSKYDAELEYVNVYDLPDEQIDDALALASGYVLTGGCDVDPTIHGHGEDVERCGKLDARRDSIELLMTSWSFDLKKPILGVCRGLQVMNVQAGGDLIIDLPEDRYTKIHQGEDGDVYHEVLIDSTGYLYELTECLASMVVSNHHQAIGRLGEGYEVLAYSPDSIIEAIRFADEEKHPFALAVQWHPERMSQRDPLAGNIVREFLRQSSLQFTNAEIIR